MNNTTRVMTRTVKCVHPKSIYGLTAVDVGSKGLAIVPDGLHKVGDYVIHFERGGWIPASLFDEWQELGQLPDQYVRMRNGLTLHIFDQDTSRMLSDGIVVPFPEEWYRREEGLDITSLFKSFKD